MADYDYDVLVIGAGPGGYVAAIRSAQLGLRTACVDRRETLGGTCLNVGCIPSKALLHASEAFEQARRGGLAALGVKTGPVELDLDAMQGSRLEAIKGLTSGIAQLFRKNKVERLVGEARFESADTVRIGERRIRARNIIIATGSTGSSLPEVIVDHRQVLDSTSALELSAVPKRMIVVGGGVIGLELGSVWRRLGAEVSVIEYQDQILPGMDEDVRKEAAKLLAAQGLHLHCGMKVVAVETSDEQAVVRIEPVAGGAGQVLEAEAVLIAVGRRPNTEGLGLEAAGVSVDLAGRIVVDSEFRTGARGIRAIGDVIAGPMLAHKAEDEGVAVAELIAGRPGSVNHAIIPSVVYTLPEIAGVGLTEAQARATGQVKIGRFPMAANSRARANHESGGFVKVIADAETDVVLGVWIIAGVAGTMIAQAAQAMEFGATSEDISYTCHAHPTHSEAIKEAAMAVRGLPIHA